MTLVKKYGKINVARLKERVRVNMHFTEDRERYDIFEDIPASNDRNGSDVPIRRVLYLRDRRPRFCNDSKKGCGGALEYRDKVPLRPLRDEIEGKTYDIVIYKKRFKCQKCGRVYTTSTPEDFSKGVRAEEAAIEMLRDPKANMQDLAKKGKFLASTGAVAVKTLIDRLDAPADHTRFDKRYEDLRNMINSFHLESALLFIPFEYRKVWRCLVCTCSYVDDESFLLDILDSDELAFIEEFSRRIQNKDIIQEVHCDANMSVVKFSKGTYSKATVYIARICMLDALRRYRIKQQEKTSQSSYQKLRYIIQKGTDRTWEEKWKTWKNDLDQNEKVACLEINRFITTNKKLIDDSFGYEMDIYVVELLKLIKGMQNNSFRWMRYRMLFSNHSHYEKTHEPEMVHAIRHMHSAIPKMSIENFGVRIPNLIEEIHVEQKIIEESELKEPIII